MNRGKKCIYDIVFCFTNYFIAYIPAWFIRRLLYMALGMKIGKKSRIGELLWRKY